MWWAPSDDRADPADEAADPAIVLQGHVDVVPPGDPATWAGDAFTPHRWPGPA